MKRSKAPISAEREGIAGSGPTGNGHVGLLPEPGSAEIVLILERMQAMRDGDFSVRLPGSWTGLTGKIADSFNQIVMANQRIAAELKRVGHVVGKREKLASARSSMNPEARGERWRSRSTRWSRTFCGRPPR